ncbi:hypothetical protein CsSME_00026350 [Camellia sinensis var. sinensis]
MVVVAPSTGGFGVKIRSAMEGVNHGQKEWRGFWGLNQHQRLERQLGFHPHPQRFGDFRGGDQRRHGPKENGLRQAWRPQTQQEVLGDGLGPLPKGLSLQNSGYEEDPLVHRVFELLHRSVGSRSTVGSSSSGEEHRRPGMSHRPMEQCDSPETRPSRGQSVPSSIEGKGEVSQMLILRSDDDSEEGDGLRHTVDNGIGIEGGATVGQWADEGENLPLVLLPLAMEIGESTVVEVGTVSETPVTGFQGNDPLGLGEVSAWVLPQIKEVSSLLGVSFVGHEEAMKLFSAIEASWRGTDSVGQ